MAKDKKKTKKHATFFQAFQPIIRNNRVLISMLGALGTGIALGTALGTEIGVALVDKITKAVRPAEKAVSQPGKFRSKAKKKTKPGKRAKPLKPDKSKKMDQSETIGVSQASKEHST